MLIINRKTNETVEKMLRRYKRKHRKIKLMRQLRNRKHYTKPSVERRKEIIKAKYSLRKIKDLE